MRERVMVLTGSQRRDDCRSMGIGDALYEARMQYIRDTGYTGRVITSIWEGNRESNEAAERHGFFKTGVKSEHGMEILELRQ